VQRHLANAGVGRSQHVMMCEKLRQDLIINSHHFLSNVVPALGRCGACVSATPHTTVDRRHRLDEHEASFSFFFWPPPPHHLVRRYSEGASTGNGKRCSRGYRENSRAKRFASHFPPAICQKKTPRAASDDKIRKSAIIYKNNAISCVFLIYLLREYHNFQMTQSPLPAGE